VNGKDDGIDAGAREWLEQVTADPRARAFVNDRDEIEVDVSETGGFDVQNAPPHFPLRFVNVGANHSSPVLLFGRARRRQVTIEVADGVQVLKLAGEAEIERLAFERLPNAECRIQGPLDVNDCVLTDGAAILEGITIHNRAILRDARINEANGQVPAEVHVSGTVEISGQPLNAERCVFASEASLTVQYPAAFEVLLTEEDNQEISISGQQVSMTYVPPDTCICGALQSLVINPVPERLRDRYAQPLERITFENPAILVIRGDLMGPSFSGQALQLERPGLVTGATVHAVLGEVVGSLCQGDEAQPLVADRIGNVNGAELENIDLFHLRDINDADGLRRAARLVPWFPSACESRKRQLAMTFGTDDERVRRRRRANFWARIDVALQEHHAPGSIQSNVRLAEARARRRSLDPRRDTREWVLLSLFALIGYGERIVLPLLWWFAFVVLGGALLYAIGAAPDVTTWYSSDMLKLLGRLAAAPLTLFRVEGFHRKDVPGAWDTVIWTTVQVIGVVSAIFTIFVIRRVTRPGASL
jgi:hypothetical protein